MIVEPDSSECLIALGGNLPFGEMPPEQVIDACLEALSEEGFSDINSSCYYVTEAFPAGSGPDFVNAALCAKWPGRGAAAAEAALAALHATEARFGRSRAQRWGPRTLDLDLLAFGDLVLPDGATQDRWRALGADAQRSAVPERLILPHPRLQDRAFVLVPLAEVAPGWRHPRTGATVAAMRDALAPEARAGVRPLVRPQAKHRL